jgi:predicted molibdopterin-dependent oxidoreductase YjgC
LKPTQRVEMSLEDATVLDVNQGDQVEVTVDGNSVQAVVAIHERMRPGAVFLIEGTAEASANALRNGGGETVEIRKLELADVAPADARAGE